MAAGEPGVLIDDAAQPFAEAVIGALPQCPERPSRRYDRIVVHAVAGADLGDLVGHAGAAGDAVDQAFGAFEDAVQDLFGGAHLPQHVHMDAAFAARRLVGDASLVDAAGDREADQLVLAFAPGCAVIDLWDQLAIGRVGIRVDAGEGADPPAAAQAPELSPFETEMPLPPSTSGQTSRPEMTSGLNAFTLLLPISPRRTQGSSGPTASQGRRLCLL